MAPHQYYMVAFFQPLAVQYLAEAHRLFADVCKFQVAV